MDWFSYLILALVCLFSLLLVFGAVVIACGILRMKNERKRAFDPALKADRRDD